MKLCLVILALYVLGINAQDNPESEKFADQCLKELKKDSLTASNYDAVEKSLNDDERTCVLACMFRKNDPDKKNLYEILTAMINTVGNLRVPREELFNKLNACKASVGEGNDCEAMKCIELFKPPFSHLYLQN